MGVFVCSLCTELRGITTVTAHAFIKNCFVCYSPVGLMNASSVGFQSSEFGKTIPQVRALKVGVQDMLSKPLQGEAGSWGFPLHCMVLCQE